jgi:hypothetical protein
LCSPCSAFLPPAPFFLKQFWISLSPMSEPFVGGPWLYIAPTLCHTYTGPGQPLACARFHCHNMGMPNTVTAFECVPQADIMLSAAAHNTCPASRCEPERVSSAAAKDCCQQVAVAAVAPNLAWQTLWHRVSALQLPC